MKTLLLSKISDKAELEESLRLIREKVVGENFILFSRFKISEDRLECIPIEAENEAAVKEGLKDQSLRRVILLGYEREEKLSITLIMAFFSCGVDAINGVYGSELARYAPFSKQASTTLLVFPGAMLPLNMGSHQRAFLLLSALNYSGYPTDVIITGGNAQLISRSKRLLQAVSPNVYTYKNNKRKLPDYLWLRREVERIYRKCKLGRKDVPELFADRLSNKATESLKKTLASLQDEKQYKNIIVSYAWMSRCLEYIPDAELSQINLICDTHDIQYMRNASSNKNDKRFLPFSLADEWLEKKVLSKYNHVLAISKSDVDELKKTKKLENKTILTTSAFNYAFKKPRRIGHKTTLNFGFIGGGMDANVKALEYILENWWPKMSSYSPASKFFIAGSICYKDSIVEKTFFDESVVKMGFVDSISNFYDRIDVALNPVLVQGGLNFKSVESVLSGKLLITNDLGVECLGEFKIASVANSPEEFLGALREVELMTSGDVERLLEERQRIALKEFGEHSAYQGLKQVLVQ